MGEKSKKPNAEDIEENRIIAAVGYLGILFLVPLLIKPESRYCQFHSRQAMALFILEAIYGALCVIPILGWFVIAPLGGLLIAVLVILGLANALAGRTERLPLIGSYAEKL